MTLLIFALASLALLLVILYIVVGSALYIAEQLNQSTSKAKKKTFRKDIETVLDTHTIITWCITFTLLLAFDLDLFVALGLSQLVALPYCFYRYQTKYRYLPS